MDVQHDPNRHRFFLEVSGGPAELAYHRLDERTVDLVHTQVPDSAAGQGIGGKLARAAFAWARQNGMKVVATCPFVRKWLERHPDEQDLVIVRPTGG
jgi:predicted GNAT family acetyltransferase